MPRVLSQHEVERFREELCDAAARLFDRQGVPGVTMRALAQELGCSPMTPYRYFRNKEEIFEAVRLAAFDRFGARIEAAARRELDPLERFRALGRAYVGFAIDEPAAYRIMFQLDPVVGPDGTMADPPERRGWQVLLDTIEACIRTGSLEGEPVQIAHMAWCSLHGAVTLHLAGRLRWELGLDDLIEPLLQHFVRGSQARPNARGA